MCGFFILRHCLLIYFQKCLIRFVLRLTRSTKWICFVLLSFNFIKFGKCFFFINDMLCEQKVDIIGAALIETTFMLRLLKSTNYEVEKRSGRELTEKNCSMLRDSKTLKICSKFYEPLKYFKILCFLSLWKKTVGERDHWTAPSDFEIDSQILRL